MLQSNVDLFSLVWKEKCPSWLYIAPLSSPLLAFSSSFFSRLPFQTWWLNYNDHFQCERDGDYRFQCCGDDDYWIIKYFSFFFNAFLSYVTMAFEIKSQQFVFIFSIKGFQRPCRKRVLIASDLSSYFG